MEHTFNDSDDSDEESIWSLDSDEAYEADNIYYDQQEYYDDIRENNTYHLGMCKNYGYSTTSPYVLLNVLNVKSFFKYSINSIMTFLTGYSPVYVSDPKIDIIKVYHYKIDKFQFGYNCIIKTMYLRLIQKCWKRQLQRREEIYKKRMTVSSILYRQLHGRWPDGLNCLPGLYGLYYSK